MLSLGHLLISDLVVTNLFMHSLSGIILLNLAESFYTKGEISFTCNACMCVHAHVYVHIHMHTCAHFKITNLGNGIAMHIFY